MKDKLKHFKFSTWHYWAQTWSLHTGSRKTWDQLPLSPRFKCCSWWSKYLLNVFNLWIHVFFWRLAAENWRCRFLMTWRFVKHWLQNNDVLIILHWCTLEWITRKCCFCCCCCGCCCISDSEVACRHWREDIAQRKQSNNQNIHISFSPISWAVPPSQ